MKYTLPRLINEHTNNPEQLKYVFFWGHTQKNPNAMDDSCFSQWFPL